MDCVEYESIQTRPAKWVKSITCFRSNTKFTILSSASCFKNFLSTVSIKKITICFPLSPLYCVKEGGAVASVRHQPLVVAESVLESGSSKDTCVGVTAWCGSDEGVQPYTGTAPVKTYAGLCGCGSGEEAWPCADANSVSTCGPTTLTPRSNAQLIRMNTVSQRSYSSGPGSC